MCIRDSAYIKRFACSGVSTIRDCTPDLGNPGITRTKSTINSELEWVDVYKRQIVALQALSICLTSPEGNLITHYLPSLEVN